MQVNAPANRLGVKLWPNSGQTAAAAGSCSNPRGALPAEAQPGTPRAQIPAAARSCSTRPARSQEEPGPVRPSSDSGGCAELLDPAGALPAQTRPGTSRAHTPTAAPMRPRSDADGSADLLEPAGALPRRARPGTPRAQIPPGPAELLEPGRRAPSGSPARYAPAQTPAAARSCSTRSARSQEKSGSVRPKWPKVAVCE